MDPDPTSSHRQRTWMLVVIGLFKLFKALLLVLIGLGAVMTLRDQVGAFAFARRVLEFCKLDPDNAQIHAILGRVLQVSPGHLELIGAGSFLYAAVFIVEGIGLVGGWFWAEYMVIASTSLLLPYEIYECVHRASAMKVNVIVVNLAIVAYIVHRVWRQARERRGNVRSLGYQRIR